MDSITQATLGAAVGEATLGHKVGNRAILWGAIAGTLPDLDIVAYPLMDEISQLGWHRGPSHAFFYLTLAAPALAWVIQKIHRRQPASWRQWALLVYLGFVTHVILDAFTVYGTQLFRPFSHYPVGFNNLSIIDPIYTVPLLAAVIAVLFIKRTSSLRRKLIAAGLAISTLYIGVTIGSKLYVNSVARENFETQQIPVERYMSTPTIFNSVLWRVTAQADDGFYVGYYSLFDSDNRIDFAWLPQNDSLLRPVEHTDALARLRWFSRGYYLVREIDGEPHLADLRFGTVDAGRPDSRRFIFQWKIKPTPERPERGHLERVDFASTDFGSAMNNLWRRILGD